MNRFTGPLEQYKIGLRLESLGARWVALPLEQLNVALNASGKAEVLRREPDGQVRRLADLGLDGILWRVSENVWPTAGPLVDAFATGPAPLINSVACLRTCASKWATHLALTAAGLPSIPSQVLLPAAVVPDMGTAVTVVKPDAGASGRGVQALKPGEQAGTTETTVAQPLVPFREGEDISVLVCGGRAVAAMYRTAGPTRSGVSVNNVEAGGTPRYTQLTREASELAEAAARTVDAVITRVDLVPWKGVLHVLDANGAPGLARIDSVSPVDCNDLTAQAVLNTL
ncbi:hypothetical protein OG894_42595 (plasmid) [Streptomyces sp. NBC_01724]|uniref:ATP-grasp domain-containing protein n=1 Tax=Streptomyces sp. NBC_01724 TaxID=2975922 RepID=UPI002E3008DB|nr:hypothetical protein [Streptomyces sp. NBC_01724]